MDPFTGNQAKTSTNLSNNKQADRTSQPIVRETQAASKPECSVKSELRDKSPSAILRTAKQKLRNNGHKEATPPREKSPNATLREAKLRLRKLEIEAEAVQRSYLDYRKRQMETKEKKESFTLLENSVINIEDIKKLDKPSKSSHKLEKNSSKSGKFMYKDASETMTKDFDKYFREYQNIDVSKTHFCDLKSVIEKIKPIPESYSQLQEKESNYNNINYLETPLLEFRKFYQTGNKIKNNKQNNLKSSNNNLNTDDDRSEEASTKLVDKVIIETSSQLKLQKNDEMNDINQDIVTKESQNGIKLQENKGDNNNNNEIILSSQTENGATKVIPEFYKETVKKDSITKSDIVELNNSKEKIDDNEVDIFKDNESSLSIEINEQKSATILDEQTLEDSIEVEKQKSEPEVVKIEENINNNNILIVEIENICAVAKTEVTESNQDMLVVVESSIDNNGLVLSETHSTKDVIPTQMTIIVSPKEDSILKDIDETDLSPAITKLSEKDVLNAIYHSDNNKISSIDLQLDENKLELDLNSDIDKEAQEYQDDFSADVDNYNSQSEYGNNSPISLPQTSENDNFWDS